MKRCTLPKWVNEWEAKRTKICKMMSHDLTFSLASHSLFTAFSSHPPADFLLLFSAHFISRGEQDENAKKASWRIICALAFIICFFSDDPFQHPSYSLFVSAPWPFAQSKTEIAFRRWMNLQESCHIEEKKKI